MLWQIFFSYYVIWKHITLSKEDRNAALSNAMGALGGWLGGFGLAPTKVPQPPRDCLVVVRQSERKFISPSVHRWSPTVAHTPTLIVGGSRARQGGGCSPAKSKWAVCMHACEPMTPHLYALCNRGWQCCCSGSS